MSPRLVLWHPAAGGVLRAKHHTDITPAGTGGTSSFTLGETKPTAANTGPSAAVGALTPITGDLTITTAGTVVQNSDVAGFIKVRAANVTIRDCIVRGSGPGTTNTGLIDCNHAAAAGVLVENCLLVPNEPSYWLNAIIGHDYTIRRCEAYNVVDFCGVYNSTNPAAAVNVVIEGNYFHDLAYISPDPNHSDNRTHNDGVQIQGNTNTSIVGNVILGNTSTTAGNGYPGATLAAPAANPYYPSVTGQAIGITPNVSQVGQVTIDRNWLDYGAQSITIIPGSKGVDGSTITITNNRFGRNQPSLTKSGVSTRRPILIDPTVPVAGMPATTGTAPALGNIFEDTGTAVTIYREVG